MKRLPRNFGRPTGQALAVASLARRGRMGGSAHLNYSPLQEGL